MQSWMGEKDVEARGANAGERRGTTGIHQRDWKEGKR